MCSRQSSEFVDVDVEELIWQKVFTAEGGGKVGRRGKLSAKLIRMDHPPTAQTPFPPHQGFLDFPKSFENSKTNSRL
jgi:hypothetical protein